GTRTSGLQGRFHRLLQLASAILLAEFQQTDHLPGTTLLPLPRHQRLPDPVETRRPQTRLPLLIQSRRSRQSPRLPPQHVEVVLQLENLLLVPVTTRVASHTVPFVPQLHRAGVGFGVDLSAR